ncbi:MAG: hypothetical protein WBD08_07360 [Candidatus Acidiferrales bacterium]
MRWNASFVCALRLFARSPYTTGAFVSLSVKSSVAPAGPYKYRRPMRYSNIKFGSMFAARSSASKLTAFFAAGPGRIAGSGLGGFVHAQVLRNQICGTTSSCASSLPRLNASTRITISSADAFAYSTTTSKYAPPSNTPVSSSSYSGPCPLRARFSSISF